MSETSQKHLKRDVSFVTSLRHLKYISKKLSFCEVFKTSQIHLKNNVFFVTSLRRLRHISRKDASFGTPLRRFKYISIKMFFHVTSLRRLKHISKRGVLSVTYQIRLKNISWKYLWQFRNIPQKWFHADKINVGLLKTLKKQNIVFWEQCIVINHSVMSISGLMFACCLSH